MADDEHEQESPSRGRDRTQPRMNVPRPRRHHLGRAAAWLASAVATGLIGLWVTMIFGDNSTPERSQALTPAPAGSGGDLFFARASCGPLERIELHDGRAGTSAPVALDTSIAGAVVTSEGRRVNRPTSREVAIDPARRQVIQVGIVVQNSEADERKIADNVSVTVEIPRQTAPAMSITASARADTVEAKPPHRLTDALRVYSTTGTPFYLANVRSLVVEANQSSTSRRLDFGPPTEIPTCATTNDRSAATFRMTMPPLNPDGSLRARREAPEAVRYWFYLDVRPERA